MELKFLFQTFAKVIYQTLLDLFPVQIRREEKPIIVFAT